MKVINLSQASQANFTSKQKVSKETPKAPEQKKNGAKLLATGATVVAAITIATLAIKKSKAPKATKLTDLKFNKGIAMKDTELFTGVAEYRKKGNKFVLEYKDGMLLKSSKNINPKTGEANLRKGNFVKTYTRKGESCLEIKKREDTINGTLETSCVTKQYEVNRRNPSGKLQTSIFKNGKISEQHLFDGTEKRWYENGQISSVEKPDGTFNSWHTNGQMCSEKLPDGTNRTWYDNGRMKIEKLPNGTESEWFKNGQIKQIEARLSS